MGHCVCLYWAVGRASLKDRLQPTAQFPHCQGLFGCQCLPSIFLAYGLLEPEEQHPPPSPLTAGTARKRALQVGLTGGSLLGCQSVERGKVRLPWLQRAHLFVSPFDSRGLPTPLQFQMLATTPLHRNPKWKQGSCGFAFCDSYRQPEGNTCPGDTGREKHPECKHRFN